MLEEGKKQKYTSIPKSKVKITTIFVISIFIALAISIILLNKEYDKKENTITNTTAKPSKMEFIENVTLPSTTTEYLETSTTLTAFKTQQSLNQRTKDQYKNPNEKMITSRTELAEKILRNMDQSVNPCDDFYRFACGGFINKTIISNREGSISTFSLIEDQIQKHIKAIIEEPILPNEPKHLQLPKSYYKTCINRRDIKVEDLKPLQKIIKQLGGWPILEGDKWNKSQFDWMKATLISQNLGYPINYFFNLKIHTDQNNISKQIIYVNPVIQTNKPSREYNDFFSITKFLGANHTFAESQLKEIKKFDNNLDQISRNIRVSERITVSNLTKNLSNIMWKEYLNKVLFQENKIDGNETVIVTDMDFIPKLDKFLNITEQRTLANYIMWKIIKYSINFLPNYVIKSYTEEDRSKHCLKRVSELFPMILSASYVKKYYDKDAKKIAVEEVVNIRNQFYQILNNVLWMDEETKKKALEKAKFMGNHIAYPDEVLDDLKVEEYYKNLEFSEESYLEKNLKLSKFNRNKIFNRLREPINKTEWISQKAPNDIYGTYSMTKNNFEIPFGILQDIIFGKDWPKYVNYGGIGYIIGHEITHAFGRGGNLYNKDGFIENWWNSSVIRKFNEKANCFKNQYSNYKIEQIDSNLDGLRILTESIADNGGIKVAYLAYLDWSIKNGPEEKLPKLDWSSEQMFWISAANSWCGVYTDDTLKKVLLTFHHSPKEFRVLGPFSNMPEFAKDFNCPIGSKMNPEKKCSFW